MTKPWSSVTSSDLFWMFEMFDFAAESVAEVPGFAERARELPTEVQRLSRFVQFAGASALDAPADAGLEPGQVDPERFGISLSTAFYGTPKIEEEFLRVTNYGTDPLDPSKASRDLYLASMSNTPGIILAPLLGTQGPCVTLSSGYLGGIDAIGNAYETIGYGDADVMVAGASEAPITPITAAWWPYDAQPAGWFVLGEGCGVVVLEEREHAARRGAVPGNPRLLASGDERAEPGPRRARLPVAGQLGDVPARARPVRHQRDRDRAVCPPCRHGDAGRAEWDCVMNRVALTGIGVLTPAGSGLDALWASVESMTACITGIDRFDASGFACPAAGQAEFTAAEHLPASLIERTARCTHLAVFTARQALADARVAIGVDVCPERGGVMVGNVLGGWELAERDLRTLWTDGARALSPGQVRAWLPAAPQKDICSDLGITGPARTFVADRASGAYVIARGAEAILRGQLDVVLAGGVEAPLSPYGWLCLETSGLMAKARAGQQPAAIYRPFDAGHGGTVFGEGGIFLVLEHYESVRRRGVEVYGEIAGWGFSTDGYMPYYTVEPTGRVLARAMRLAAARSKVALPDVGAVFAHGSGVPVEDVTEGYAIREAFGDWADHIPVTAPKAGFGHLLGAAAPVDVALALRAMRLGRVPATVNLTRLAPGLDLDFVQAASRSIRSWEHSVIISRGLGGVNACPMVRR
jgi:3-oxoacyl-(acyl-carrier-protein) synthase